jgi:hypothetical protein
MENHLTGTGDDKKNQSDYDGAGGEGAEALDATELAKQLEESNRYW